MGEKIVKLTPAQRFIAKKMKALNDIPCQKKIYTKFKSFERKNMQQKNGSLANPE